MKKDDSKTEFGLTCPLPVSDYPSILLAHGGGGKLTHDLIAKVFAASFSNPLLDQQHDGAICRLGESRMALTTDSYVIRPLFFPGGDIGRLAVHGTVNDLAMCGARPLFLTAAFILEEGLPMETLWRIVQSMKEAARTAGVLLVTGDTKVVDRGKGDGVFINTTGIGVLEHEQIILPESVRAGDAILLSGDLGRHGVAIMNAREDLGLDSSLESDSQSVSGLILELLSARIEIHCLRDLTRGGLASALIEIAQKSRLGFRIEERAIPVREDVKGACEILGLDPLYVANEGRFVAFVPLAEAEKTLQLMRSGQEADDACLIGRVVEKPAGQVTITSRIGVDRIVDMISGEQLPRIC